MLKAMMFIDGSWFDFNVKKLLPRKTFIEQIRFEPIWDAVRAHAKAALGFEVDLVRCYCVAGHPDPMTVGQRSVDYANRIVDGWEQLRRLPCMSVDLYPYDYGGNEFPRMEGAGESGGRIAKEKCVDVALATKMLYFAAVPAAYDLAVLVTGDSDFLPVIEAVRNLGKRTMLASFLGLPSCAEKLKRDEALGSLWDLPPLDLEPVLKR